MAEGYYCSKCDKFVLTVTGKFLHPHEGIKECFKCARCGTMVYLREQGGKLCPK